MQPDGDGIMRRVPLVFSAYGKLAPSLALALLNGASGSPRITMDATSITLDGQSWSVAARAEV